MSFKTLLLLVDPLAFGFDFPLLFDLRLALCLLLEQALIKLSSSALSSSLARRFACCFVFFFPLTDLRRDSESESDSEPESKFKSKSESASLIDLRLFSRLLVSHFGFFSL